MPSSRVRKSVCTGRTSRRRRRKDDVSLSYVAMNLGMKDSFLRFSVHTGDISPDKGRLLAVGACEFDAHRLLRVGGT